MIPQLGPLFDSMKDIDSPSQPTAASALVRFEEICMALRQEDYERMVEAVRWHNGILILSNFGHITLLICGRGNAVSKGASCVLGAIQRCLTSSCY